MKTRKKNLVLLLLIIISLTLSCGNSNLPNLENTASDNSQTDEYALLREQNQTLQRPVENLSGNVVVLSQSEFIDRITAIDNPKGFQYLGQTPCVVELYADWCKPCGYQSQLLREMAPEYQGKVIFYKLNIDRAREVVAAFNVISIPMMLYFKPHGGISTTVGYLDREELKDMIDKLLLTP